MNIDNIVRVTSQIAVGGALRREFGITLFVTPDTTLTTSDRLKRYSGIAEVGEDFATDSEPYKAANIYFSQVPFPKNLMIGRWYEAVASAQLVGGSVSATIAAIAAITGGSLKINAEDIIGIDFTGDTTFADVASTLQTALQTATDANLTNATVSYSTDTGGFIVDSVTTGATATLTVASAAASGTDISDTLALSTTGGAASHAGVDAETVSEALDAFVVLANDFYFITNDATMTGSDEITEIKDWVEARKYMYRMESNDVAALTTNESSTKLAEFLADAPGRTFGAWTSADNTYLGVSSAGRLSSINFAGSNSLITLQLKSMPGINAEDLTTSQSAELDRKRTSYYVDIAQVNSYINNGGFAPSVWDDVRYFLDWFDNAVQIDVFNLLASSPRIPQTEDGSASTQRVIESVCEQAVTNGGVAPGQVSEALRADIIAATGNADFDGFLPKGYLVYIAPYSDQSQSDRNARKAQPVQVWLKGSGAVHSIDIAITFEN